MITIRDREVHTKVKKLWDKAFSKKEVERYVWRGRKCVLRMVEVLRAAGGREVDAVEVADACMFDM